MTARQDAVLAAARAVVERHPSGVLLDQYVVAVVTERYSNMDQRFMTNVKRVANHLRLERATATFRNLVIK